MSSALCGIDEAGRGAWAGPVCAGAVMLEQKIPPGITDSKKLTPAKRQSLSVAIKNSGFWGVGWANSAEIDRLDIRKATHLAMIRAMASLLDRAGPKAMPDMILIDGNDLPIGLPAPARAIIGGDQSETTIAAASIIAKTARDRFMQVLDDLYPGYGFARHKGYGVAAHARALQALGPCPVHRYGFRPIRAVCSGIPASTKPLRRDS